MEGAQRLDGGTLEQSGNCSLPKYVKMIDGSVLRACFCMLKDYRVSCKQKAVITGTKAPDDCQAHGLMSDKS